MRILTGQRLSWTLFVAIVMCALMWQVATATWIAERNENLSNTLFRPLPAGMAPGPKPGAPPLFMHPVGADGCTWVRIARAMAAQGEWRLRHVDFDNAPDGREMHWNSGFAWWLIALGWLEHKLDGLPLENTIPQMAQWANPILFVACLILFPLLVARRFGPLAGSALAIAMIGIEPFHEGFFVGYPDHHGMHNAAIVGCVLGLVCGGLGRVRTKAETEDLIAPPMEGPARRWFLFSAISGAVGFWASALTLAIALLGIGLGAVATFVFSGRERRSSDVAPRPELWRFWGMAGGIGCLFFYLLEYAPNHFGMRLEVNHPLYALAWMGGGELLCQIQRAFARGRFPSSGRQWLPALAAIAAVSTLPLALVIGGARWYLPFDGFLFQLHKGITEFQSFAIQIKSSTAKGLLMGDGAALLMALLNISLVFFRSIPKSIRALLWFTIPPGIVFTLAFFYQSRWALGSGSVWVAAAPCVALGLAAATNPAKPWRRLILPALAGAAMLAIYPSMSGWMAWRGRFSHNLDLVESLQIVIRDVAQFVRAEAGPDRKIVVLASPNSSLFTSYYANCQALGTLYWENLAGLRAAAGITGTTSDEEAYERLRKHGVTHIVHYSLDEFIAPYFILENPGQRATTGCDRSGGGLSSGRISPHGFEPCRIVRRTHSSSSTPAS